MVANWYRAQPSVGEESITDWMLYELDRRVPWISYRKFTKSEEARRTGADWEWWIVASTTALAFRIQAKILKEGKDLYRALAHTNSGGLQIEMLIEQAHRKNMLPFYTLYYAMHDSVELLCRGKANPGTRDGVFLAAAHTLHDSFIRRGRNHVEATDILALSNPLSCLFCCPHSVMGARDPARGALHWIEEYYADAIEPLAGTNESGAGLHSEPPSYVTSFLEHADSEIPEWWEEEFQYGIEEINALMVLDMRNIEGA